MPQLARTIHFDASDQQIFENPATTGEWAVSGAFAFADWTGDALQGKARQAFANGWMGIGSFGRATFVAVARIEEAELATATRELAAHLLVEYGAPSEEAALAAAEEEIGFMLDLCHDQEPNTLLAVQRELQESGVHEQFRNIVPKETELSQLAVHGSLDF